MTTLKEDIRSTTGVENAFTVTPNDSVDLSNKTRAISVAVAGNVVVIMAGGQSVTIGLSAGTIHYISVTRILATLTTATGIIAYY